MPNLIVDKYRKWFPEDTRSDAELTLHLGDTGRAQGDTLYEADPQFRKEYLDLKQMLAPSLPAEFGRTLSYGTDIAQGQFYSTAALAGRMTGIGPLERFGTQGYERNLQEAAGNEPTISDIRDVRNVPEAIRYGLGLVGSQGPQLGATVAGAVGGFALGGLAGPAGAVAGAGIGGGAAGFTQMQNYSDLVKSGVDPNTAVPVALGVGAIGAVLEVLVPLAFTLKVFRRAGTEAIKKSLGSVLAHVPVGMLAEATTETLQEITTIAGEQYAHRDDPRFKIRPEEIRRRLINAAAAGGVLGGVLGGAGAALAPSGEGAVAEPETETTTTPPPPVTQPGVPPPGVPPPVVPPVAQPPPPPEAAAAPEAAPGASVVAGAYTLTPEIIGQLELLAQRELSGDITKLELALILNTPELRVAYEQILGEAKLTQPTPPPAAQPIPATTVAPAPTPAAAPSVQPTAIPPAVAQLSPLEQKAIPKAIADLTDEDLDQRLLWALNQINAAPDADKDALRESLQSYPLILEKARRRMIREAAPSATPPVVAPTVPPVAPAPAAPSPEALALVKQVKGARRKAAEIGQGLVEEKAVAKVTTIDPEQFLSEIDFDGSGTEAVGPAVNFDLPDVTQLGNREKFEDAVTLGARSDLAGVKESDKINTKKLTFFRDQDTGKIIALGTYRSKVPTISSPDPKRVNGLEIRKFLAKRSAAFPTEPRYVPLLSVRLKQPRKGKGLRIEVTESEYNAVVARIKQHLGGLAATQAAAQAKMPAAATMADGERKEFLNEDTPWVTGEQIEEDSSAMFEGIFTDDDANFLFKKMEASKQPVIATRAIQVVLELANAKELELIFKRIIRDAFPDGIPKDPSGKVLTARQTGDLMASYVARELEDAYEIYKRSQPEGQRKLLGAKGLVEETGQPPVVQPGASQEGGVQGGVQGTGIRSRLGRQKRADTQRPNGEIIARYNRLVERLKEYGIPVKISVDEMLGFLEGEFVQETRSIVLTVDDATEPRVDTFWMLMHETAHAVLGDIPADKRSLVLAAIVRMSDEALGIEGTREMKLKGTLAEQLATIEQTIYERETEGDEHEKRELAKQFAPAMWVEERLVEHLTGMGMEKGEATGFIHALIRAIRELYLRALMALQDYFGRTPSDAVALEYMRIRFMQVISGDKDSLGFIGFMVPNPTLASMAERYVTQTMDASNLSEMLSVDGRFATYPHAVPNSQAAIDYNARVDQQRRGMMRMPFLLPAQLRAGIYGTEAEQQLNSDRPFKLALVNGKLPVNSLLVAMPNVLPPAEWELYKEEGIEAWIKGKVGGVTLKELQDWIDTHGPQLETVPLYAEPTKRPVSPEEDQLMVENDDLGQKFSEIHHRWETDPNGLGEIDIMGLVFRATTDGVAGPSGTTRDYVLGEDRPGGSLATGETGEEPVKLIKLPIFQFKTGRDRLSFSRPGHAYDSNDPRIRKHATDIAKIWSMSERQEWINRRLAYLRKIRGWTEIESGDQNPSATRSHQQLNPKPLARMPGAVDLLVRIPLDQSSAEEVLSDAGIMPSRVMFRAGHYGTMDKNIVSWVRGYFEALPNGDKVFFISELQGDWPQLYGKFVDAAKTGKVRALPSTPSQSWVFDLSTPKINLVVESTDLPGMDKDQAVAWVRANPEKAAQFGQKTPSFVAQYYQQLAFKAAIKHAIDNGAKHIAFSDAETAMLTEQHDQLARMIQHPEGKVQEGSKGDDEFGYYYDDESKGGRYNIVPAPEGVYAKVVRQFAGDSFIVRIDKPESNHKHYREYAREIAELYPNGLPPPGTRLISQEKGMRLNYDQSGPGILKSLTGYDGEMAGFGNHQNAITQNHTGDLPFAVIADNNGLDNELYRTATREEAEGMAAARMRQYPNTTLKVVEIPQYTPREDLWFKNPDGTPKTEITGRVYPLDKVITALEVRGGFTIFSKRWMQMLPEIPGAAERLVRLISYVVESPGKAISSNQHNRMFASLKEASEEEANKRIFDFLVRLRMDQNPSETKAVAKVKVYDRYVVFLDKYAPIGEPPVTPPPGLTEDQAWDTYPFAWLHSFSRFKSYVVGSENMAKLDLKPPKFRWGRQEKIGDRNDPSVIPNTSIAALNEQKEVEARVAAELARIPAIVEDARHRGISLTTWLRRAGGLPDVEKLIHAHTKRLDPTTQSLIDGVDPAFRLTQLTDDASKDIARLDALKLLSSAAGHIGKRIAKYTEENVELEAEREAAAEELQNSARNYTDIDGLTKLMGGEVRRTLRRLFRDLGRDSHRLGVIGQQVKILEGSKMVMSNFARVFADMYTTGALDEDALMVHLDAIANDPEIDLALPINVIRDALAKNPRYAELTKNTPESKALLATLIGYAKINPRLVALVNLRRVADPDRRIAINAQVDTLLRQGLAVADRVVRRLPKVAVLEDRLLRAYREDIQANKHLVNAIKKNNLAIAGLTEALPFFEEAQNQLAGPMEVRAPTNYGDGFVYMVPPTATANNDSVIGNKKTIRLTGDNKSTRAEIEENLVKMTEWLKARYDAQAIDGLYNHVLAQRNEISRNGIVIPEAIKTSYTATGLVLSDAATQFKAFGTASARVLGQMINRFAAIERSLRGFATTDGHKNERNRQAAVKIMAEGSPTGASIENYLEIFYSPAWNYWEQQRDLAELYPGDVKKQWDVAFTRLLPYLQNDPLKRKLLNGREQRFMAALRKHMEGEWETSQFHDRHLREEDVGVVDESIMVMGPEGKKVPAVRKRQRLGLGTVPRGLSQAFNTATIALVGSNWAAAPEVFKTIVTLYDSRGVQAVEQLIQPYFADEDVREFFFKPLALDMGIESAFTAPVLPDGVTRPEADPVRVAEAYKLSDGNVMRFIENMYQMHHGETPISKYYEDVLGTFAAYYAEYISVKRKVDPVGMSAPKDWQHMIPAFMVNARKIGHWPSTMTQHISFDAINNQRAVGRSAAQISFGIDSVRFAQVYDTLVRETQLAHDVLRAAIGKLKHTLVTDKRGMVEKALADEVGGKQELARLRKLVEMNKLLTAEGSSIRDQLMTLFRGRNSPVAPVGLAMRLVQLFSSFMLNQPASALGQLADLFGNIFAFGVSPQTLKQTMRVSQTAISDLAGGLFQGVGLSWQSSDEFKRQFIEDGQGDPLGVAKLSDIMLTDTSPYTGLPQWLSGVTRKVTAIQEIGLKGRGGSKTPVTVLRILAPFKQINILIHRAHTINMWKWVDGLVAKGVKAYNSRTIGVSDAEMAGWSIDQWVDAINPRFSKRTVSNLLTLMRDDWGLDFYRLVKEANANRTNGEPNLSKRTRQLLMGLVVKEITSEANISTMPLSSFNSSIIRFVSPLLGWPFRRGQKVVGKRLDVQGQYSTMALMQGFLALAVAGAGGLAISAIVDLYNEELLRKRRNLRRLTGEEGAGNLALAIVEHSARVGTMGLFGDIVNEAVNVGTGEGANRGISLDQRIVFVNSLLGLWRSAAAFINQDFEADYAGVIRPVMYALGGNGALQYLQLASANLGFETFDSAANQRTNVGNWLRAVGRELDFEVQISRAGYSTPTPVTPHITRMVLAAYDNDRSAFRDAHREAIAEAKEQGHRYDAEEYIRNSFRSRHPIRSTFRTALTERQYKQLLRALPWDGREAVEDAVRTFNRYGAELGIEPFTGKEVKVADSMPSANAGDARRRAAMMMSAY